MTAASLVASIGFGAVSWQVPARTRMMLTVLVLSVCSVALLLPGSIAGMYVAAFVAGIAISPSLISVQHVLGELAPTGQISEAFALMGSSIAVGTAVATACSGVVVNDYGSRSGLLTVVAIAVATSIAGVAGWATLRGAAPPTPTD
jgi:MFS family permease